MLATLRRCCTTLAREDFYHTTTAADALAAQLKTTDTVHLS